MSRIRTLMLWTLPLALALVLGACSSSTTGKLEVALSGLPSGATGKVQVKGPGGYAKTVSGSATLSVAPASYSLSATNVRGNDAIAPKVYLGHVAAGTVRVSANATTTASVSYTPRPGSGHLWVPMFGSSLEAESFASGDLASGGSPAPDVTLGGHGLAEAVAFGGSGNLWVADNGSYVYRYDARQLSQSGNPTPAATLDLSSQVSQLYGLAFDSSGDLWVSDAGSNDLSMFTPAQIATSGAPTATVVIHSGNGSLAQPNALTFDGSGRLWVGNFGNNTVVAYDASQRAASGSPTPAVKLASTPGIAWPNDLAFDPNGNLWVANDGGTVTRFDAGQLAASGSPKPAATVTPGSTSASPAGLAFDASGGLWVSHVKDGTLARYDQPGTLNGSVSPTSDVTLTSIGSVNYPLIAFDPPAKGLPIHTP